MRSLRSRRGFTLIELISAATITAILAGFIIAIVSNVSGFWSRSSSKLSTEAQARLILDQIALDLSSAIYRDDGNVWMAADVINANNGLTTTNSLWQTATANAKPVGGVSLAMNAAKLADARYGNGGVWFRFFTTKRGANSTLASTAATNPATYSAPVAVGYQIIRRFSAPSTASTKTGYLLHRAEVRPIATSGRPGVMESGYTITAAAYTTSTAGTNNGATIGDPRSIQVPGSRTNFASVIGDNVIDFGIRCYVRDPTQSDQPDPLRVVFPAANATGVLSNATNVRLRAQLPSTTVADSSNYNFVFPDVVDVMVRIVTDEGSRLLASYEQANSPLTLPAGVTAQQYWWQLATANSQVFTRRIVLNPNAAERRAVPAPLDPVVP